MKTLNMGYSYQSKREEHFSQTLRISDIDKSLVRLYPRELAEENMTLPICRNEGILFILTVGEDCNTKVAEVEAFLDHQGAISVHQVESQIFWKILSSAYVFQESIQNIIQKIYKQKKDPIHILSELENCLRLILNSAVIENISNIHFETEEKTIRVRCRRNGILQDKCHLPLEFSQILTDILLKKSNKEGKILHQCHNLDGKFVLSILRNAQGDSCVLRSLPTARNFINFNNLNLTEETKQTLLNSGDHGVYLITGPERSGKTFSLYSIIAEHTSIEHKTITLEDFIEFNLPLTQQIAASSDEEIDNVAIVLPQQDIDILMVGNVKNAQTAKLCFDQSNAGCKVFAAMAANSAITAVHSLIDTGVSLRCIANNLKLVINQRLVRKLCNFCKRRTDINEQDKLIFEKYEIMDVQHTYIPIGCTHCFNSGYWGELIVTESLTINEAISNKIIQNQPLFKSDFENMFVSMQPKAIQLSQNGTTTLDELRRVIQI